VVQNAVPLYEKAYTYFTSEGHQYNRFVEPVGYAELTASYGMLAEFKSKGTFDGPLRVGNRILNLTVWGESAGEDQANFRQAVPSHSENGWYESCGFAIGYLHMKTDLLCSGAEANDMYHLVFRGHLCRAGLAFHCEAAGYMYGARSHIHDSQ
jgi:hypothetical protein